MPVGRRAWIAVAVASSMAFAACGGDDGGGASDAPAETEAPSATEAPSDSSSDDTEAPAETSAPSDEPGPPTGPEMVVGMVNTEGTPGLDFPDMRR
ncbi:MAG: hypothetical protein ACO39Y_09640, partial [Ilumatobacteraceae bacterium]